MVVLNVTVMDLVLGTRNSVILVSFLIFLQLHVLIIVVNMEDVCLWFAMGWFMRLVYVRIIIEVRNWNVTNVIKPLNQTKLRVSFNNTCIIEGENSIIDMLLTKTS